MASFMIYICSERIYIYIYNYLNNFILFLHGDNSIFGRKLILHKSIKIYLRRNLLFFFFLVINNREHSKPQIDCLQNIWFVRIIMKQKSIVSKYFK